MAGGKMYFVSGASKKKKTRRGKRKPKTATVKNTVVKATNNIGYPVGKSLYTKLKYADRYTVTVANGIVGTQTWNLNSIFDPDHTNVGHQPYGHDTLVNLFNRYRVDKCEVQISIVATQTTSIPAYIVMLANNSSSAPTTLNLLAEMPNTQSFTVTPEVPMVFRRTYDMAQITGVTQAQYKADDRFQSQVGTNPSEKICLHLNHLSPGATPTIYIAAQLIYHVTLFDPLDLTQS